MSTQKLIKFKMVALLSEEDKSRLHVESDRATFQNLLSVQFSKVFLYCSEMESHMRLPCDTVTGDSCIILFGNSNLFDPLEGGQLINHVFSGLHKKHEFNLQCSFLSIHLEKIFDMLDPFSPLKSLNQIQKPFVDRANFKRLLRRTYTKFSKLSDDQRGDALQSGIQVITFYLNEDRISHSTSGRKLPSRVKKFHLVNFFDVVSLHEYHKDFSFENSFNVSFNVSSLDMLENEEKNIVASSNAKTLEVFTKVCRCVREKKKIVPFRDSKLTFFLKNAIKNSLFLVHFNEKSPENTFRLLKFCKILGNLNKKYKMMAKLKDNILGLKNENVKLAKDNWGLKKQLEKSNEGLLEMQRDFEMLRVVLKEREKEKNKYLQENVQMMKVLNELKENEGCLYALKRIVGMLESRDKDFGSIAEGSRKRTLELEKMVRALERKNLALL